MNKDKDNEVYYICIELPNLLILLTMCRVCRLDLAQVRLSRVRVAKRRDRGARKEGETSLPQTFLRYCTSRSPSDSRETDLTQVCV